MAVPATDSLINLLQPYIEQLKDLYGSSLHSVILYGSYARNEQRPDSDIDIMIFVDMTEEELIPFRSRLNDITFDFNWDHDIDIEPIQKSIEQFNYWVRVYPFYSAVKREGITLYAA